VAIPVLARKMITYDPNMDNLSHFLGKTAFVFIVAYKGEIRDSVLFLWIKAMAIIQYVILSEAKNLESRVRENCPNLSNQIISLCHSEPTQWVRNPLCDS